MSWLLLLLGLLVLLLLRKAYSSTIVQLWLIVLKYTMIIKSDGRHTRTPGDFRRMYFVRVKEWAAATLRRAGLRVEAEGLDNLPPDKRTPVLYLANHQSAFDMPTLIHAIEEPLTFMPKAELRKLPIIGELFERAGHIFIDRRDPTAAQAAMNERAVPALRERSFVIFPEGTRSRAGIRPFKKGAFHVARSAAALVVPVAIVLADDDAAEDASESEEGGQPVRIAFGSPIQLDGSEDVVELLVRVRREIIELNVAAGGVGALPGTEETHVAERGFTAKKSAADAWLKP